MDGKGGLMEFVKYDPTSVEATLICVAFFWTLITTFTVSIRRLLISLFNEKRSNSTWFWPSNPGTWAPVFDWLNDLRLSPALLLALLDSVATFEICACSLECWPIRAVAGQTGLLLAIALNGIRGCVFTCRDAYGNPCSPWYRYLQGRTNAIWLGITWGMQLISAYMALRAAQIWWSLNPTVYHTARYELAVSISEARLSSDPTKPANFPSDLQVSAWLGFLIEATGICVDFMLATIFACVLSRWNERRQNPSMCSPTACTDVLVSSIRDTHDQYIVDSQLLAPSKLQFWSSFGIRLCINLFLTAKWIGFTGLYVNPANAFIQSWGIGGVSSWQHIFVYWLGPFTGVWLSVQFERWFHQFMVERSSILRPPTVPCMITSATQTVLQKPSATDSYSSSRSTSHGVSMSRWSRNPIFRGLITPVIDSRWVRRGTSSTARSTGLNVISRFSRFASRPNDAIR